MEIKFVKFGQPINWHSATETYLETGRNKCEMLFDGSILTVTSKVSKEVVLVTIGNIAYMQAKEQSGRKPKEAASRKEATDE